MDRCSKKYKQVKATIENKTKQEQRAFWEQMAKEYEATEQDRDDDDEYWNDRNVKQRLQGFVDDLTREVCGIRNVV